MEGEIIREIVRCYRSKRILWDTRNTDYYNKNKREKMWREISLSVNVPVKEVKRKMTSLLGSYRREKSREKKRLVTGSKSGNSYKSKWFAYSWFEFLSEKNGPNDTTCTMDDGHKHKGSEESQSIEEIQKEEERKLTTSYQDESPASQSTTSVSQLTQTKKRKRRSDTEGKAYKEMQLLKNSSAVPDHYEAFGSYVASELRKYDIHTLPHVKKAISDVLFRADIGEYTPSHFARNESDRNNTMSSPSTSSQSGHNATPTPPPFHPEFIDMTEDIKPTHRH